MHSCRAHLIIQWLQETSMKLFSIYVAAQLYPKFIVMHFITIANTERHIITYSDVSGHITALTVVDILRVWTLTTEDASVEIGGSIYYN